MSDEEMNKKMEFIVEQQAKFAADIEMMRAVQAADATLLKEETKLLKEQQRILSDAVLTVVGMIRNLTEVQQRMEERLTEAQQRMEERLTEAQQRTEERLNIFINVVERYISGNGGGTTNPA